MKLRQIALSLDYHLFKKERALAGRVLPARLRSYLRRRMRARFLLAEARPYRAWMREHLRNRGTLYRRAPEPGLFSILTAVWNGSPVRYLEALANSIAGQNQAGDCEWIILDNGCTNRELLQYFDALKKYPWIRVQRSEENLGIVRGLRLCLERAAGTYVLPVDADDLLYPDCLRVVAAWIHKTDFPPLLYTDEDKVVGARALQPYLKPDFDPVLLLNSAYIAHLGVIEREVALELGAYTDVNVEGSADWDLFVRFLLAGRSAVHIPEIVYSWRMHSDSTAEDAVHKPYIASSQRAVLERYLCCSSRAEEYSVEHSPLLPDSVDWWLRPLRRSVRPMLCVWLTEQPRAGAAVEFAIAARPESLLESIAPAVEQGGFVTLLARDLRIDRDDWMWEALGLMERHPDTVMVGGRIRDGAGRIAAAGYFLGFDGDCGCPDRGRKAMDRGYFTQLFKQHSVSAVSSQFAVLRASFLRDLLRDGISPEASIPFLGAWAGAYALRTGKRVAYSPFLSAVSETDWDALVSSQERAAFRTRNSDILPDHRFYPRYFGLKPDSAYQLT